MSAENPVLISRQEGASRQVWRGFVRHWHLFWEYFAQYSKMRVGYRGDFFITLATSFAATVFGLLVVYVLFNKAKTLQGWTLPEEVFLYGFSLVPYGIFNVLSMNLYDFGNNYIIEGKFDRVMVRPVSTLFQVLFEQFRLESFQETIVGFVCIGWASVQLHLHWTVIKLVLLLFWTICGAVIYISVFLLLTTTSFWFEDRIGVHPPVWNVYTFGRWPLSIYSGAVQFFLCWIIPFGLASFYPSVRFLGRKATPEYLAFVPVVALAFLIISISMWNYGTRHYSSTGS